MARVARRQMTCAVRLITSTPGTFSLLALPLLAVTLGDPLGKYLVPSKPYWMSVLLEVIA